MCVRVASLFAGLELKKLGLMAWLPPPLFFKSPSHLGCLTQGFCSPNRPGGNSLDSLDGPG